MRRVVITGGPCSGKTSCLKAVQEQLSEQIVVIPEVATILLQGGFPVPAQPFANWPDKFHCILQEAILNLQRSLEEAYFLIAQATEKTVLVCDRGILDGAAYWPDGLEAYLKHFAICPHTINAQYDAVIHLESLATAMPEQFSIMGNKHRYESLTEAQERERATYQAWLNHPLRLFIPGNQPLDDKIEQVLTLIRSFL